MVMPKIRMVIGKGPVEPLYRAFHAGGCMSFCALFGDAPLDAVYELMKVCEWTERQNVPDWK
jgi:hypothetical protein